MVLIYIYEYVSVYQSTGLWMCFTCVYVCLLQCKPLVGGQKLATKLFFKSQFSSKIVENMDW